MLSGDFEKKENNIPWRFKYLWHSSSYKFFSSASSFPYSLNKIGIFSADSLKIAKKRCFGWMETSESPTTHFLNFFCHGRVASFLGFHNAFQGFATYHSPNFHFISVWFLIKLIFTKNFQHFDSWYGSLARKRYSHTYIMFHIRTQRMYGPQEIVYSSPYLIILG